MRSPARAAVLLPVLAVVGVAVVAGLWGSWQGSAPVLVLYVASSLALLGSTVLLRPSYVLGVLVGFVTLGFLAKSVLHLGLGVKLIEPVGDFTGDAGQWDRALTSATAGQVGLLLAVLVAGRLRRTAPRTPSAPTADGPVAASRGRRAERGALVVLALGLLAALALYAANYRFRFLRIGYPPLVDLGVVPYLVVSFALTWGALLGALALAWWLVERGRLPLWSLVVVATVLGFAASVTMGSRVQYLLYLLAAALLVVSRRDRMVARRGLVVASVAAAGVFAVSLLVVSLQRDAVFTAGEADRPAGSTAVPAPTEGPTLDGMVDVASNQRRLDRMVGELRSLVVMRWVGLEGVMTTASTSERLDTSLLADAATESPGAGTGGIYQTMARTLYDDADGFTFLTLPGVVAAASLSGSAPVVVVLLLLVGLVLHLLEVLVGRVTRSRAVRVVAGVSLAYLTAQMGFPLTLAAFLLELGAASALLGLVLAVLRRAAGSSSRGVDAQVGSTA